LKEQRDKAPLPPLTGESLRSLRALEVLERIGNTPAKQLLAQLADGAPEATFTREARNSCKRLERKP